MTSLICLLIFILFFTISLTFQIKRNKIWNNINYVKSRYDIKGIFAIHCISFIYMLFFLIINLIIGEDVKLCIGMTLCSMIMLFMGFLVSRISIMITNDKIIKKSILSKSFIKINEIIDIEEGYFIIIRSKTKLIKIETKFYDKEIIEVKKLLRVIKRNLK